MRACVRACEREKKTSRPLLAGQRNAHADIVHLCVYVCNTQSKGHIQVLKDFGVDFVNDTCWCMLTEPVVPVASNALITNSGKYAHYAPGLVNKEVRFSNMAGCVAAARTGRAPAAPKWLSARSMSTQPRPLALAAKASAATSIPTLKTALRLARFFA